jgi:cyclopropane fatty-acyl-phospholipid synthase-like methyltransferase
MFEVRADVPPPLSASSRNPPMQDDFDVPANWYEQFFTPAVNNFWESMVPPEATAAELDFVTGHIPRPPARILDVPCGAGRHALGLAARGYDVTGIDLSEDAIERASAAAGALPARFVRADMREFPIEARFDAAICLGNSIGYFGPEGMAALFARLAAALRPGGKLILDSATCAESLFPLAEGREIAFDGGSYSSRYAYDAMQSLLKTDATLVLNGETHRLRYAHSVVTSGAMVRELARYGLKTEALYGDVGGTRFALHSPRLLLVAERAAQGRYSAPIGQPPRSSATAESRSMR